MDSSTRLVYLRERRGLRAIARQILAFVFHIDLPLTVTVGPGLTLLHRGVGTIVHPATRIGSRVTLMHQVTIGVADERVELDRASWPLIHIEDDVTIGAGAKILAPASGLTVGAGTRIGANAVLLESTGIGETWVGVPARRVR